MLAMRLTKVGDSGKLMPEDANTVATISTDSISDSSINLVARADALHTD